MSQVPAKIWLYHITHISNLSGILKHNALLANNQLSNAYINIAHKSIQVRRHRTQIICENDSSKQNRGLLHDYVPFYFATHSPMLYAISKNRVENYSGGQQEVIYLVTELSTIQEHRLNWVFSDGHAAMDFSSFYDNAADFEQIDWPLMKAQYWFDTDDDPDRKRRRQAELLIHDLLPWACIKGIGTYDDQQKGQVEVILSKCDSIHKPPAKVLRKWYY